MDLQDRKDTARLMVALNICFIIVYHLIIQIVAA